MQHTLVFIVFAMCHWFYFCPRTMSAPTLAFACLCPRCRSLLTPWRSPSWRPVLRIPPTLSRPSWPWRPRLRKEWARGPRLEERSPTWRSTAPPCDSQVEGAARTDTLLPSRCVTWLGAELGLLHISKEVCKCGGSENRKTFFWFVLFVFSIKVLYKSVIKEEEVEGKRVSHLLLHLNINSK